MGDNTVGMCSIGLGTVSHGCHPQGSGGDVGEYHQCTAGGEQCCAEPNPRRGGGRQASLLLWGWCLPTTL